MIASVDATGLGNTAWWPLFAALLGVIAGWCANIAIERLPRLEPLREPIESCLACGARRRLLDALPIVGYLAQGGRCRRCRARMTAMAPVVEMITGVLWALLAVWHGPSIRAVVLMLFVTALLALVAIDYQHYLLPDAITLPGIVAGVAATWLPGWPVSLRDSALSAALGYFAMMALAKAGEWYYREPALGQGDWKMVAMLGAFLGSTKAVTTVLLANGAGALVGLLLVATLGERGRQKLPLGSFLGASGILMAFF